MSKGRGGGPATTYVTVKHTAVARTVESSLRGDLVETGSSFCHGTTQPRWVHLRRRARNRILPGKGKTGLRERGHRADREIICSDRDHFRNRRLLPRPEGSYGCRQLSAVTIQSPPRGLISDNRGESGLYLCNGIVVLWSPCQNLLPLES